VSYTDAHGTAEGPLSSAQTAAVANVNDAPVGAVSVSGTPTEDQVLSASNTLVDADGLGAVTYQWQRNGVNIAGATGTTYTLGNADPGSSIRVVASYTDAHGTNESVASAAVGPIINVNDAPAGANNTVSILQDTSHVFGVTDFGFIDPNDSPANNLLAVRISAVPLAGSLTDNGAPVTVGQLVSVADINAGWLVFTPASGASAAGYASFTFQVQDDGGGTDIDPTARAMTMSVNLPASGPVVIVVPPPVVVVNPNVNPPPPFPLGTLPPAAAAGLGDSQGAAPAVKGHTGIVFSGGGYGVMHDYNGEEYVNRRADGPIHSPDIDISSRRLREYARPTLAAALDPNFINAAEYRSGMLPGAGFGITASLTGADLVEEETKSLWSTENGAQLTGLAISVGFVSWALRGAGLLTSLLASTPAWRNLDPLPILGADDDEDKKDHGDADEEASRDELAVSDLWAGEDSAQPVRSGASAPRRIATGTGAPTRVAAAKKGAA
jgi:hypothetical protein